MYPPLPFNEFQVVFSFLKYVKRVHCTMYIIMSYVYNAMYIHNYKLSAAPLLISVELKTFREMNRRWVSGVGGDGRGGGGGEEKSFSVMQWNILAQTLALNGNFQFATSEVLEWQHRKDLIVKV